MLISLDPLLAWKTIFERKMLELNSLDNCKDPISDQHDTSSIVIETLWKVMLDGPMGSACY